MRLSKKLLYVASVLSGMMLYHFVFAQMPPVTVGLSLTGENIVDERTVVSSVLDESGRDLENDIYPRDAYKNVFADSVIDFNVFLSRPLVDGERVNVPLEISGAGVTTDDIKGTTLSVTVNTGVRLGTTDSTIINPLLIFEDAGAQVAAVRITVKDDNTLEYDEVATIDLGDLNDADTTLPSVVPHPTSNVLSFTIRDDEYVLDFSAFTYPVSEGTTKSALSRARFKGLFASDALLHALPPMVGSVGLPVNIERGLQKATDGLKHGIMVGFRYIDIAVVGDETTTNADDIDYLVSYSFPNFAPIAAGVGSFNLELPIIDDARVENNELLRIAAIPPNVPSSTIRDTADVIIIDDDPRLTITGASVYEGTTASFTVTSSEAVLEPLTVNLHVSEATDGNYVLPADKGDRMVTIAANQSDAVLNIPTIDYGAAKAVGRIVVELRPPTTANDYSIGSPAFASVQVRNVGTIDIDVRVFLEGTLR